MRQKLPVRAPLSGSTEISHALADVAGTAGFPPGESSQGCAASKGTGPEKVRPFDSSMSTAS